tara:strand:- start:287 stop:814 length:528 start_codon:yes stop_codon:yes gene_type:complete
MRPIKNIFGGGATGPQGGGMTKKSYPRHNNPIFAPFNEAEFHMEQGNFPIYRDGQLQRVVPLSEVPESFVDKFLDFQRSTTDSWESDAEQRKDAATPEGQERWTNINKDRYRGMYPDAGQGAAHETRLAHNAGGMPSVGNPLQELAQMLMGAKSFAKGSGYKRGYNDEYTRQMRD